MPRSGTAGSYEIFSCLHDFTHGKLPTACMTDSFPFFLSTLKCPLLRETLMNSPVKIQHAHFPLSQFE